MFCSFNKINFVGTFYIYFSWLQVLKVGGKFYFTKFLIQKIKISTCIHLNTCQYSIEAVDDPVFIKRK